MKILGIIPARYDSTRFPGKPLVVIDGKTMIRRVYEQALTCPLLDKVIVATDNRVIESHVAEFGGIVMMTAKQHRSGTERCSEVAAILEKQGEGFDVIVNIQGDEPFIDPAQISQVCECFTTPGVMIATLVKRIRTESELADPNIVKVVFDKDFKALYFSRSTIPYLRGKNLDHRANNFPYYRHIGIYGYSARILQKIVGLTPTPLEEAESLEQLRWLGHGFTVHVRETELESVAIDTPADLLKITNKS